MRLVGLLLSGGAVLANRRLIVKPQSGPGRDRVAQLSFDRAAQFDAVVHLRAEQAISVATAVLCPVQSNVGTAYQLEPPDGDLGRYRNPYANADMSQRSREIERPGRLVYTQQ